MSWRRIGRLTFTEQHPEVPKKEKTVRFDLLDEYSTLVPFGPSVSRKRAFQESEVPAEAAKRGTIANIAGHLELPRKLLEALRQVRRTAMRSSHP